MTVETIVYSILIAIVVCLFVYIKYIDESIKADEEFIRELSKNILDLYDYIHSIEIKQQIKINCNIEELTKSVNEVEEKLCKMKK